MSSAAGESAADEAEALPTADQLEEVFYAALKAQDMEGVIAALRVMIGVDSTRALHLHESLQDAVNLAQMVNRLAVEGA